MVIHTLEMMLHFSRAVDMLKTFFLYCSLEKENRVKRLMINPVNIASPGGSANIPLTVSLLAAFLAIGGNKGDTD